jgi:hypothetical protein
LSTNVPILTAESFYTFQCGAHSGAALFKKFDLKCGAYSGAALINRVNTVFYQSLLILMTNSTIHTLTYQNCMISSAFELSLNVSELSYNKLATKTMNNTTAESTVLFNSK